MLTKILLAFGLSALMIGCLTSAEDTPMPSEETLEVQDLEKSDSRVLIEDGPEAQCLPSRAFTGATGGLCARAGLEGPAADNPLCCSGRAAFFCPARHEHSEERCL